MIHLFSCVFVCLALGTLPDSAEADMTLFNLSILGSTDGVNYGSTIQVISSRTYSFEIVGQIAPVGTVDGTHTISSLMGSIDGVNSISVNVSDSNANLAVGFNQSSLALQGGFNGFLGASTGTALGTSLNGIRGAQAAGTFVGVNANNAPTQVILETGTFTTGASLTPGLTSTLGLSFGAIASSIKINDGANTIFATTASESGTSPIFGYNNLAINSAVPEPASIVMVGSSCVALALVAGGRRILGRRRAIRETLLRLR